MSISIQPVVVAPHSGKSLFAGPVDWNRREPEYSIVISIPSHVAEKVSWKRMINIGKTEVFFIVQNDSDWLAFISLFKGQKQIQFPSSPKPIDAIEDYI